MIFMTSILLGSSKYVHTCWHHSGRLEQSCQLKNNNLANSKTLLVIYLLLDEIGWDAYILPPHSPTFRYNSHTQKYSTTMRHTSPLLVRLPYIPPQPSTFQSILIYSTAISNIPKHSITVCHIWTHTTTYATFQNIFTHSKTLPHIPHLYTKFQHSRKWVGNHWSVL